MPATAAISLTGFDPGLLPAAMALPAAMLLALLVDRWFGEPPTWAHPVVAMGRWLGWSGTSWPDKSPPLALLGGAAAWLLGAALVTAAAVAMQQALLSWLAPPTATLRWLLAVALLALLLKPMLAWRKLQDEVLAVEAALARSLPAGRAQVARLCSRNSDDLTALQVREAAIETLAENLNDSVLAPLFWCAVAGLPGAVLYRYANTADAMWGYRGRWEWAGKFAARADDVLSWLPARLAGVLLLPQPRRWPALRQEAGCPPSPNGGWPMGAMALALGIALGKPGALGQAAVYRLNADGRDVTPADTQAALRRAGRAVWAGAGLLAALAVWTGWAGLTGLTFGWGSIR